MFTELQNGLPSSEITKSSLVHFFAGPRGGKVGTLDGAAETWGAAVGLELGELLGLTVLHFTIRITDTQL